MIQGTKMFKVSINGIDGASDEQKGFLDNKKVSEYEDFDSSKQPIAGETLEQYKAKARGYVRFYQMCMNLQKGLDFLGNIETVGADHIEVPTKMEFVLSYTQPDGLTVEVEKDEYVEDDDTFETRDGRVFFKGMKAIKRLIAKVLVEKYTVIGNYYDNSVVSKPNNPKTVAGYQLKELKVYGPCATLTEAENLIMVEEIL